VATLPDNTYPAARAPSGRHDNDDHEERESNTEALENNRQYKITANHPEGADNKAKDDN
jgi:hypothetical protein